MATFGSAPSVKLATLFYELEARTKGVDKDLKETERSLSNLSNFIKANPVAAFAGLSSAAIGASALVIGAAVKLAAQFETEMAKVNTVAQLSKEELLRLGEDVQKTFRELPVKDTKALTDALYQVVSSGVAVGDAMNVVRVATKGAIGGFTDAETVVDAITSIMNAYKDKNISAAKAGDVLALAVKNGKIEMGELAGSIGQVLGVSSAMGVSIEEVAAVTTQLSLNGIAASEGITSIRAAINDILRPTDKLREKFPDLAKNFTESRLRGDGFVKFLQDFIKESDGSSEALKAMFNSIEGYKLAVQAAKDGGKGFADQLLAMKNASGEIDAQFRIVNETAEAQYQIIKNNLTSAFTTLGQQVLPTVNEVLGSLVGLLQRFNGEADRAKQNNRAVVFATEDLRNLESAGKAYSVALREALDFADAVQEGKVELKDMDSGVLAAIATRLHKLSTTSGLSGEEAARLRAVFNKALEEQVARGAEALRQQSRAEAAAAAEATAIAKSKAEEKANIDKELGKKLKEQAEDRRDAEIKIANETLTKYQQNRTTILKTLADTMAESTETLVDDMQLALSRAIEEFRELGATADEVGRFTALREGMIRAQQNMEDVNKQVKEFVNARGGIDQIQQALLRVNNEIANQIALRNRPGISDAERVAAEKNIETLTKTRTDLEGKITQAKETQADKAQQTKDAEQKTTQAALERLSHYQNMANAIQVTAQGALKMANAFGLVSSSTSKSLSDIITIAAQVPAIVKATDAIVKATASGGSSGGAWGALAGGLLAVGGVIADGIAQDKAARRERERVMNSNTRAVQMLTKVQGDLLNLQLSGKDFSNAQDKLSQFLSQFSNLGDFREFGKKFLEGVDPKRELEKLGLDFADIQEIAKTLGITLDGQIGSYRRLLEAMRAADLSGFVDTFTGQLDQLEAEFNIRAEDFKAPSAKLKAIIGLLTDPKKGAPALFDVFNGLDLSTAEGQAAALEKVQKLFDRLKSGDLTQTDLGNLSLSELKDIITRLNDEIRTLQEGTSSGGSAPTGTGDTGGGGTGDTGGGGTSGGDTGPTNDVQVVEVATGIVEQLQRLLSETDTAAVQSLADFVDEVARLNALLYAPDTGVATSQRVAAPVFSPTPDRAPGGNFILNLTVAGDVVGDLAVLASRLVELMLPTINEGLGREYLSATINTGEREVTVA